MQDSTSEKRIMRRRGRPRKSEMENSTVRKPRALRLSDEEEVPDELQRVLQTGVDGL